MTGLDWNQIRMGQGRCLAYHSINHTILSYRWFGKCWHVQDLLKYEFDIEFDVSKDCISQTLGWCLFSY